MINYKIDPQLLSKITTECKDKSLDCVVYANNFYLTKRYLIQKLTADEIISYPFINAFGVKLKQDNICDIANLNTVNYITSSSHVSALMDISHKVMKLEQQPIKPSSKYSVAIIDTGVDNILDLTMPQNRIIHFEDFVNDSGGVAYDDNGHGTFVASVLSGNGLVSGKKFAGINPNAKIISLKALDKNGETGAFTILKAMQWVYDHKNAYNIRVVCMSFGSYVVGKNDPLIVGAEVLWDNGIIVVSAAGNSGPREETIKSPGASNKIITVGALNDNRETNTALNSKYFEIAEFSSRGPILGNYKPDLVAPGVNIKSACNYKILKTHYNLMSGTSVATPMIAGVCSLIIDKNPKLTPNQIKNIIMQNCDKIEHHFNSEGQGLINCLKIF